MRNLCCKCPHYYEQHGYERDRKVEEYMKKLKFVIYICSYCGFETEHPKGSKSVTLFCPKCHKEQQFVETKKEE